jgi:predicted transcriptional regulator
LIQKKVSLIRQVIGKSKPLDKIIDVLGIKKTTAINILTKYRKTGEIPNRKYKKTRKPLKKES